MNTAPLIFRKPPRPCPPADDWMACGSSDPQAHAAYGFTEGQVVSAATAAYMDAYMQAPEGADRAELRAVMVGRFVDELERLGA